MNKHHSLKYYTDEHYKVIDDAETYEELLETALDILDRIPKPISMVCGPISTGGLGNIEANMKNYEKTLHKLSDEGKNIFNQIPFKKAIQKQFQKSGGTAKEKNQTLLDRFYLKIYSSGMINSMYFIHGWESSHGATWEREIAERFGIEIVDLDKMYLEK
jgi:hypothetical protein